MNEIHKAQMEGIGEMNVKQQDVLDKINDISNKNEHMIENYEFLRELQQQPDILNPDQRDEIKEIEKEQLIVSNPSL